MPTVKVPHVGQYGAVLDLPSYELPINAWSRAENMRFKDGMAERFKGQSKIFDTPSVTPYHLEPYQVADKRYWVHCGNTSVFADDGTTRADITLSGLTSSTSWNGGVLHGVLTLNNGVDQPMFWGGNVANDLAVLTGWNANWRAKVVRPFKNYLVALDVTKTGTRYENMVKWSHVADPGAIPTSWDETDTTKDAGEQDLSEEASAMVDCLPLGDVNIIYKERAMFAQQFVGYPYIFRFQRLPGDVGMLAQNCAVNTPIGHVVLVPGDVIAHNGQGPTSIANAQVRRWIFNNIDSTSYKNAFVTANPARNEVWICYPEVGQTNCTIAAVYNWIDKTWGLRDLPNVTSGAYGQINYTASNSWAAATGSWNDASTRWNQDEFSPADARLLIAGTNPSISLVDAGATFEGTAFTSVLERTGISLDDPQSIKTIRSIYPRIDAANGTLVQVEVGGSMNAEDAPQWSAPSVYTVGTTNKVDSFATGRFLSVRFTALDNQPWRLKSYDLDVIQQGLY